MQREIDGIAQRCTTCGKAIAFVIRESGLTDSGEPWLALRTDRLEHPRDDCQAMLLLAREEWPTLW